MSIERIIPENEQHWLELRTKDVTSTEVSALFGFSPYITEFELWHRKKTGVVVKINENERMKWGTALQDAIAKNIAEENSWEIHRMNEYIRDSSVRAGSSFDFSIDAQLSNFHNIKTEAGSLRSATVEGPWLLEIKNVDSIVYRNDWFEDDKGNIEAPLHIEIQVQHQLMVSGRDVCYIGALVGGNRCVLIKRERNDEVIIAIRNKLARFWDSIDANKEPKPDFIRDAEFISKLYGYSEPGKVIDVTENEEFLGWAAEYKQISDKMKELDQQKDALKAKMLIVMGDAEKVEGGIFSISAGIIGEAPISYVRKAYRNFKPTWRKQK